MHNLQKEQIILGITQGISELLPISSSMHLTIIPKLTKYICNSGCNFSGYDNISAKIMAHLGSLLVFVIFFRKILFRDTCLLLTRNHKFFNTFAFYSAIATLCTSIMTIIFKNKISTYLDKYDQTNVMITANIISGILLYLADKKCLQKSKLTASKSFIIGVIQFLASISGVSRLGITITACRLMNINRNQSVSFAMFCAIPAIFGAIVYDLVGQKMNFHLWKDMSILFCTTIIFGLSFIKLCNYSLVRFGFLWIMIYRIFASIVLLMCR